MEGCKATFFELGLDPNLSGSSAFGGPAFAFGLLLPFTDDLYCLQRIAIFSSLCHRTRGKWRSRAPASLTREADFFFAIQSARRAIFGPITPSVVLSWRS